jgi:uncharacterized protein YbjT (DUF2867 family)
MARGLAAVTGATGFLGRHLVRELSRSGWRVRVLARRDVIHPLWRNLEPEVVIGDLADEAALARLCRGADLVVHAAGLIKGRNRATFEAVNIAGARRVAEHAPGAMLLVSSLAAREPKLSDYAASKRGGEEAAQRVLGDRLTIVRPPALYGPGDPETLPLFKAAASSPVLPLLDPRTRLALMHVEDAARQIAALAELPPHGQPVTLSDLRPEGYGWREILETAAEACGSRPRFVRIPDFTLTLAAAAGLLASARGPAPMISFGKAREIRHRDWSVSRQEQPIELPPPLFDLRRGFLHTLEGYKMGGLVLGNVR